MERKIPLLAKNARNGTPGQRPEVPDNYLRRWGALLAVMDVTKGLWKIGPQPLKAAFVWIGCGTTSHALPFLKSEIL